MNTTSPAPTPRRVTDFLAHATPIAMLILIPVYLGLNPVVSLGWSWWALMAAEVALVTILTVSTLRHGKRPCARCVEIRQRRGADGARRRALFIRLFHHRTGMIYASVVVLAVGIVLPIAMEGLGAAHPILPGRIMFVVVFLIAALYDFSWISHAIYRDFCPVERGEKAAAEAA